MQNIKLLSIIPTEENSSKKFTATFNVDNKIKKVSFGAKGYSDYTIHKDKARMERYQNRHSNDRIHEPLTPGALSWYILWGPYTSLKKNISFYKATFNV